MSLAGKTIVDEILEDRKKVAELTREASPDRESAETEARKLYEFAVSRGLEASFKRAMRILNIPIVVINAKKFIVYNIILGENVKLTGMLSLKIFEEITENENKINDKKIIIIYYSKRGNILKSAYLFLGYLIEKHKVGILFVNGSIKEVFEIIDSLIKRGEFKPEEEDYVELKEMIT